MARIRDRMARRHVREKAVVQHVAKRLFEPKASAECAGTRCNHSYRSFGRGSGPQKMEPAQGRPAHLLPQIARLRNKPTPHCVGKPNSPMQGGRHADGNEA
jgi:hypothetical protein